MAQHRAFHEWPTPITARWAYRGRPKCATLATNPVTAASSATSAPSRMNRVAHAV